MKTTKIKSVMRLVRPSTGHRDVVTDSVMRGSGFDAYANTSWYNQLMRNAGTRLQRYAMVDAMDTDIDISRALDTIAEEMSSIDQKTQLPFEIFYEIEENKSVDEHIVMTIRAALRYWCNAQDMNNRIFRIARNVIKYGDCFFRRSSDTKKWVYINPADIIGIEVDEFGSIVSYQIRDFASQANMGQMKADDNMSIDIIPARHIIHFSLSEFMDNMNGPFGVTVLQPVMKTYRQLTLLEDSVIIYRIVRAPERRVFYIDTANMNPNKVKQYLESVKNEIKQKRVPLATPEGGQNIDSVYNPTSMLEDYFISVGQNGRGSRVETLPGGENLGQINDLKYFQDKIFRGLRIPNSYMSLQEGQQQSVSDGQIGVAYIEELRFANYVMRLQKKIESVFDSEFKKFLRDSNINIDSDIFKIVLPEPQNFALYRKAQLDQDLVNTFTSLEGTAYISKRYLLRHYLGFTEDDIQTNEAMLRQELGIPEGGYNNVLNDMRMMYDPAYYDQRPDIKLPDGINDGSGDSSGSNDPFADDFGSGPKGLSPTGGGGNEPAENPEPASDEPADSGDNLTITP